MDSNADSQGDGSSYQEHSYYDALDGSLQDPDTEYQTGEVEQRSPLREQDRFLPIANVAKIMRRAVPSNGKIAKDAKECVQECVSEFISFITSEAAERCQTEKRKTINGEDILCAMNTLGFDNYVEPLKSFLVKFREMSKLESSFLEESPSVTASSSTTTAANPAGSTVILTPTLVATNATGLTTVGSNPLTAGRHFTLVNGTTADLAGATVITPQSAGQDIKLPTATMTNLGTPISTSLGTTIILPISPQLALMNGATTTVSASNDPSTDSAAT